VSPPRRLLLCGALCALAVSFGALASSALAAGGSWSAESRAPTYLRPEAVSSYAVIAAPSAPAAEVTIRDTLPAGVEVKSVSLYWSRFLGFDLNSVLHMCSQTGQQVACDLNVSAFGLQIEPGQQVRLVVRLNVSASAVEGPVVNEGVVEGGGLTPATVSPQSTISAHPAFGIASASVEPTEATRVTPLPVHEAGVFEIENEPYRQPFTLAGGHPWGLTTRFQFATEATEANSEGEFQFKPTRDPKDVVASLPPGLLGDPMAVPRCPLGFVTSKAVGRCPADTQIGVYRIVHENQKELLGPIVNVTPEAGQSAEFALENNEKSVITPLLTAHLIRTREPLPGGGTREGYGFDVADNGVPDISLTSVELTFWGVPADPSHDPMRGRFCGTRNEPVTSLEAPHGVSCAPEDQGGQSSNQPLVPFLSFPTDCSAGAQNLVLRADSWELPGAFTEASAPFAAVSGCDLLGFNAGTGVSLEPDTLQADAPVGLGVTLKVPLNESPGSTSTPAIRDTAVTLPQGLSISPGVVDGIHACDAEGPNGINISGPKSEAVGLNGELQLAPGHCPDASIVGTAEAITPFLPTPVKGHVYLARPGCGAPGERACSEADVRDGSLYRLYLELGGTGQFANTGIQFKVPLQTHVDPATGQITATSSDLVQAPYSEVKIHLNGGPRAPLDNPSACGPATTSSDFTPWSAPGSTPEGAFVRGTPDLLSTSFFEVDLAGDGSATPCPSLPFSPGFQAGTVSPQAGQFSTFTLNLARQDREQYLNGIQIHTPPGLLGMLSSVPLCGEPQADDGTCPESSKIGSTRVASGAGSHPFEIEGGVYLTGPHDGSPFGLSIVVHLDVGPFHLGVKVVRARIAVDPTTSQLTVTTDETGAYAIPQAVFGVPVRLKRVTVNIDRSGFMFNPTSCQGRRVTAAISGSGQAVANLASPFAAAGCKSLEFHPQFAVSTSGHTSKQNGASLDAKVSYPPFKAGSEANIAYVKVELPKQLPSRLTTLQKACLAATFDANPAGCPGASIIGVVRASTPVLPVPLSGPVYFVSHGGEEFPSLVAVLQGDGVRVDLTGSTFISKSGVTSSTFKTVPDVPVSTFELYLPEGRNSALAANTNLCVTATATTIKRTVTKRVHGRLVHRTVTLHVTKPASLSMPTEFVAQNGAVMRQTTKIAVTGCTTKAASARRHARLAKHPRPGR
jgi:hypothetical protein